jgi:hypothetical protein
MPRRLVLSVLLLYSPSLIGSLAQAPTANPPFEVKEGLWDLTQTTYNIMPDGWLDKISSQLTPEQRAQAEAAKKDPRSQAQVEKWAICLTRERLDQADITRFSAPCTAIQVASTGTSIARHAVCQGVAQEASLERTDAETFKGTEISSFLGDPTQQKSIWRLLRSGPGPIAQALRRAGPTPLDWPRASIPTSCRLFLSSFRTPTTTTLGDLAPFSISGK